MKTKSVIVIGAGIGGITAATHLARGGLYVTVMEKNARPGGRCDRFSREGHHFDTGPTLFVMPLLYEAEFRALGTSLREQLDLQRVDPTYHLVFDDGSQLALTSDMKFLQEQLESIQPGSFQGLLRYLKEGDRHYQLTLDKLVNRDFRQAGVEFIFNSPVERIDANATHARGVLLADGSRLDADVILANADLPYVYQVLHKQDGMTKALLHKKFSCSVISFFWGVDKMYEALGPHTLFLVDDYRENFKSIDHNLELPANPSLYVHAPARLDTSMAPYGGVWYGDISV